LLHIQPANGREEGVTVALEDLEAAALPDAEAVALGEGVMVGRTIVPSAQV